MVNRIAIIPARGGSKRIPKKNILSFNNKPMIAWTIEAALESQSFSQVVVSTDDPEIAEISIGYGAAVPFLREDKADDHSPVSEATLTALLQSEAYWKESFDTVCQLMPNCPLRTSADIQQHIQAFDDNNRDFQISSFKYGWMNPWWAASIEPNGQPNFLFQQAKQQRSQDLESLYCPTGAIWLAKSDKLKKQNTFYGENHCFEALPWQSAVDIDDYDDLDFAIATQLLINHKKHS